MKKALVLIQFDPQQLERDGHSLHDKLNVLEQQGIRVRSVSDLYDLDAVDVWGQSLYNQVNFYADSNDLPLTHEQKCQIVDHIRDHEEIDQEINTHIEEAIRLLNLGDDDE